MEKKKGTVFWIALILVAIVGTWMFVRPRTGSSVSQSPDLLDHLFPELTPTIYPSSASIVHSVQTLSRLETVTYSIEKVITAESGQGPLGFLFGDKLLLIAHGEIIAGIDLGKLGIDDVVTGDDGTVFMRLPPVEIFVTTLDNSRTQVYDRKTGVVGMNTQLETSARQEAERLILQSALEDGLEWKAEENARSVMRSFLGGIGFQNVVFVDVMPTMTPEPPVLDLQ
ncbi:MAG: DUF4230 domain-containing protein [Anaerolineae bacterium]|nr:DUF4230 domain-containing protein [Anaerolineae bacterium]